MVKYRKYSFRKYKDNYNQLFKKEKYKLKKIFPIAEIEHIGSSAVPSLGGKGILDIAISVSKKAIPNAIKKLQGNGFEYKPFAGDKDRRFLQKIIKYVGGERRVHIQLTYKNSKTWKSMVALREYLTKHKEVAKEYARVKREAVKHAKGEGKKYMEYKKSFLQKIEKLALKESSD